MFGDSIGRSFEYLLREGADYGKVTVQFTQNGSTYKLIRGFKRKGKSITQNFEELKLYEDEKLVASMKTEAIAEQFKAITGLDKELYREIVWFRQEHLKELLDARHGIGKGVWMNCSVYPIMRLHGATLPSTNGIMKRKNGFTRKTQMLLDLKNSATNTIGQVKNTRFWRWSLKIQRKSWRLPREALDEADFKLKKLEDKKQAIEEVKRKEARLHSDLVNMTSTLASLNQRIEGKKTIVENLHQRQTTIDTQAKACLGKLEQAGLPANQPFESLRASLTAFDDKIGNLRADQEATSRNLQTDKKRVVSLAQESKCPLCVQPLEGEYKSNLLSKIQKENFDREKTIDQLRVEIDGLQKNRALASEAYASLQTCMTRAEELKNRLSEEENNLQSLSGEFLEKQKLEVDLRLQLEAVQFEISRFDSSELDSARVARERSFRAILRFGF